MDYQKYLIHYGIPGMRWGRRSGGVSKSGSADHVKAKEIKKKKLKNMSNADLKTLNERMQLESQYKRLNPAKVNVGKKVLTEVLKEIGKETVKSAVKETIKFTFLDDRK